MAHLAVESVTKRYGDTVAVDGVSFEATPGRILGPNGAGKTSTLRMIPYIMVPDVGTARFDGRPVGPRSQQHKEQLAYLGRRRATYE